MDAISLSIFSNQMNSICQEMGAVLQRAAFSPNIKDRLDFSCAIFDAQGELCAQAAHIPVHLGSMAYAMRDIVNTSDWHPGDALIVNDPYLGGTHLPDVTLISPVFNKDRLVGFVVNRAHHADIGANSPGSMPISETLEEEGLIIAPKKLCQRGKLDDAFFDEILSHMADRAFASGDFYAQLSANKTGVERLHALLQHLGETAFQEGLNALNDYGARMARAGMQQLPDGEYHFTDVMDDDGMGNEDIHIQVCIRVADGQVEVDFTGTSEQVRGNINAPLSVAAAAVFYVFRCLMPADTPACAGTFRHISLSAPEGCLLNARRPAAVAAGNVETSTRIVDAVLGALAQVMPERIPAASHGSMNNIAMGGSANGKTWNYYETIGGGMGAGAQNEGLSAVQTHMTNTLNTPIESLEMHFPLRVRRYEVRQGSGGCGFNQGGNGLVREFEFLEDTQVTLLTERRRHAPWGLAEGESAGKGKNLLNNKELAPKVSLETKRGDRLSIFTPGGGGWGKPGN